MVQSVWDYLLLRARLAPHELSAHAPRGPVSRRALVEDVAGLATELLEQGLSGEGMVGLAFESSYLHLLLVLALDRLSIPTTSLPMLLEPAALAAHARHYGVTALITSEPAPADPPCRWMRMAEQHRPRIGPADHTRLAAVSPPSDSLLRVIWSSGTTGSPKGTPLTRARQMCRLRASNFLRAHSSETRHFLAMPLGTVYGYNVALGVLMAGGVVVLPGSGSFFDFVKALGINATGVNVPMLRSLLGPQQDALRRLDGLRIDVMGSSLPPALAQEARYFLTPRLTLLYGTTEAVSIATGDAALCIADPCAVGFVPPWVEAEIVDDADRPVPAAHEGNLRVRGEQIVDRYYGEPPDMNETCRGGWFYPGEIGTLADGLLRITGRRSEAVRRDDRLIGPVPIEAALTGLPGIRDAAVFPLPHAGAAEEEICAALVLDPAAAIETLRAVIVDRLGAQAPTRLIAVGALPRNANGKVLKRELQDRARHAVHQ